MVGFRISAQRDHRFVFQKEEDVTDLLLFAESDQLLLPFQASGVVNGAELDD